MGQTDLRELFSQIKTTSEKDRTDMSYLLACIMLLYAFSQVLTDTTLTSLSPDDKFVYFNPIGKILVRDFVFNDTFNIVREKVSDPAIKLIFDEVDILIHSIIAVCDQTNVHINQERQNMERAEAIIHNFTYYVSKNLAV